MPLLHTNLLVWINDVIVLAQMREELVDKIQHCNELISQYALKLSVTKSVFLCREVLWCGKILSETVERHNPARLAALTSLFASTNVADLQRLPCAGNWLRDSIINFS